MLYYFIKISLLLYQRMYFKRIYISGTRNIPQDKPVFLASNHSNGFLDGVMVSALLMPKPTYIFVRGDVFRKKWANFFLRSLKLIPIYRARDGEARENLSNNNRSFDQLYNHFKKDRIVLIFPEADAQIEKRLRPLKKGMARIVDDMQSRDTGDMEVAVVPFGLNYTHYKHYRNELMLSFDKPLYMSDFMGGEDNTRAAMNKLTKATERGIRRNMVDIKAGDDQVTETALRIVRSHRQEPILQFWFRKNDRLEAEMHATKCVREDTGVLRNQLLEYQEILDTNNTKEMGANQLRWWQFLYIAIFLIPGFLSWQIMKWGLVYGKRLVDRKVKLDELYESIYFGVGIAWNWLLILIGYPVAAIFFGWKGVLIWFIVRWLSVPYQHALEFIEQYKHTRRWKNLTIHAYQLRAKIYKQIQL